MKTVSAGLNTHIAGGDTTLATCWKATRADNTVFGFTDFDLDLVVSAVTYKARTGYTRTAIQTSAALNVDNLDLDGIFDSASITEQDLRAGLWDYAQIEIFQVNWADLSQGTVKLRKGRLGQVEGKRSTFVAELRGLLQNIQQDVGRLYGAGCDADLFDARCKVNPAGFTFTGTITSLTDNRVFSSTALTQATGYFDYGKITFTSGLNNGLAREVKTFVNAGGALTLQLPMPYTVALTDAFSIQAGCDKRKATCISKFNNVVNFRGFDQVPGNDNMMQTLP